MWRCCSILFFVGMMAWATPVKGEEVLVGGQQCRPPSLIVHDHTVCAEGELALLLSPVSSSTVDSARRFDRPPPHRELRSGNRIEAHADDEGLRYIYDAEANGGYPSYWFTLHYERRAPWSKRRLEYPGAQKEWFEPRTQWAEFVCCPLARP